MKDLQDLLIHLSVYVPIAFTIQTYYQKDNHFLLFLGLLVICIFGYLFTIKSIQILKDLAIKANIFGKDINKKGTPEGEKKIPEALGVAPASVFIVLNSILIIYSQQHSDKLVMQHLAGLFSICIIILLGFCDDVFDLRWRYKLIYPAVASIPLVVAFKGVTHIVIPNILNLKQIIGNELEIGYLYYIYIVMVVIFCTNSINIYAGINGLEVTQSIIIGCSILLHNLIEIRYQRQSEETLVQHEFSVMLVMTYVFVTLALYKYNKYPSQVFVGDTFCYWSGMVFAVAGILGHFQKTLMLMFIPQILNFLYGLPQLLGIKQCPRHRLPFYNSKTEKLESIKSNLNLINLFLWIFGPKTEKQLCSICILFQIFCSGIGFSIRYFGADYLY